MKEKFKGIGYYILGIGGFILILFLGILMIKGAVWVGEYALQWLINFSWIVLAINLFILLPLALFKKTGVVGGIGMFISSYVFGLTLWFLGLLLTYFTWGFTGVFIGLMLGGVGVIPVAMLASIVNGDFLTLLVLVILTALTFGTRFFGLYLVDRAEKKKDEEEYRDVGYEEKDEISPLTSKETENEELIYAYNLLREKDPVYNKPNYELAKKVFLDFNEFNLRNTENGLMMYLKFIPKSLLPYPKNYIKCAYYIFLEKLEKENNIRMFKNVQRIGTWLFNAYPDYKKYKGNITGKNTNVNGKKWLDDALKDSNPKESFKKIYGVYEISEEDYNNSTSSIDSTDEKLIHDFGVLPEIEEDVDVSEVMKKVEYEEID